MRLKWFLTVIACLIIASILIYRWNLHNTVEELRQDNTLYGSYENISKDLNDPSNWDCTLCPCHGAPSGFTRLNRENCENYNYDVSSPFPEFDRPCPVPGGCLGCKGEPYYGNTVIFKKINNPARSLPGLYPGRVKPYTENKDEENPFDKIWNKILEKEKKDEDKWGEYIMPWTGV